MKRLTDEYAFAVRELLRLEEARATIIGGQPRIDAEIHAAASRVHDTKSALNEHRDKHHCMD